MQTAPIKHALSFACRSLDAAELTDKLPYRDADHCFYLMKQAWPTRSSAHCLKFLQQLRRYVLGASRCREPRIPNNNASYSIPPPQLLDELYSNNPQASGGKVPRVEYAKLETASLCHVDDSYYFGVYCRKCKHHSRLSLVKLRRHLGDNFPVKDVKERLRCDNCKSRQAVITFLAPNQKSGNLRRLFEDEPKGV